MSDTTEAQFLLADLREQAGLSKTEVGRRMGVNRQRVGQIEQDFPRVRFNVVASYIEALGAHVSFRDIAGLSVRADHITPDPRGPRDHGYRKQSASASED